MNTDARKERIPAMKPDKVPIMLRRSFPAASPGGTVKVAEWMQQNVDKNLEETLLQPDRDLPLGRRFIFTASATRKWF